MDSNQEAPWKSYHRMQLRVGWSYPIDQSDIRIALSQAGVTVDEVSLFSITNAKERADIRAGRIRVLSVDWDGRASHLWVYAVLSDQRSAAREVVLSTALPGVIRWLLVLPRRGNAWEATRHAWDALMIDGAFAEKERDAAYPPR